MKKSRKYLFFSKKSSNFADENGNLRKMDSVLHYFNPLLTRVNQFGIWVDRAIQGVRPQLIGVDFSFPFLFFFLVRKGTIRVSYDLQEMTLGPNQIACIMPRHLLQIIEVSEDFVFSRLLISTDMNEELRMQALSHDAEKFHYQPVYTLTEEQLPKIIALGEIFCAILNHDKPDLPLQRRMLLAQLVVGYEFINYYRRDQDEQWRSNKHANLYNRFCMLVVEHYKESREVKYYADLLSITPKYFTRIIRSVAGISPSEWIDQYTVSRARQLMEVYPDWTIQQISYELGFCEPSAFHHFFKRVTGMTAKEYGSVSSGTLKS